ncbi:MAG TPA: hypothetical protein VN948_18865 [Terriglobales bacterium]|nr:hypothetical protein [Terriglobales bacterium]
MNKKDLSERDICSKFIGPAVKRARLGRDDAIREEVRVHQGAHHRSGNLVTDHVYYFPAELVVTGSRMQPECFVCAAERECGYKHPNTAYPTRRSFVTLAAGSAVLPNCRSRDELNVSPLLL